MSKTLILVRHAKSDWSIPGQKDFDRSLNERGHRDAPRMAQLLLEKQILIDAVITSTATRAKLTAEYFNEQLFKGQKELIENENLYEASARVWMNEVCALSNGLNTVLMVGHNPGISYFAEYLTKSELGEIPTCAIVGISFEIESWSEVSGATGNLLFYDYPKNNPIAT